MRISPESDLSPRDPCALDTGADSGREREMSRVLDNREGCRWVGRLGSFVKAALTVFSVYPLNLNLPALNHCLR
jgi:hypothetical protein